MLHFLDKASSYGNWRLQLPSSRLAGALAVALLHVCTFIALCSVSYLHIPGTTFLVSATLVLLALYNARTAWFLSLSVVAFQYLFNLRPSDLLVISGAVMLAYIIRLIPNTLREAKLASPLWIALLGFECILILHLSPLQELNKSLEAVAFSIVLLTAFLQARSAALTKTADAAIGTVCVTGLVVCVLSFVYLYQPVPSLFLSHSPIYDLRLNDMRLSGALDSPNAMAKLAMPLLLGALLLIAEGRRSPIWPIMLVASGIILAAAGSKSVILSVIPAGMCVLWFAFRRGRLLLTLAVSLGSLAIVCGFSVGVLPYLKVHAAQVWESYSEPKLNSNYYKTIARAGSLNIILSEFRIANSAEIVKDSKLEKTEAVSDKEIRKKDASASPSEWEQVASSGQRLKLFKAGLLVVSRHPLWGIGYKRWSEETNHILGTSFVSPHNGFLELWGSYGILGPVVYGGTIVLCIANFWRIETASVSNREKWVSRGIAVFVLMLLTHELFEVATIFALTPYALWAWSALGLQDGLVRSLLDRHV